MGILTGHDIREIRDVLVGNGVDCVAVPGNDNNVHFDMEWDIHRTWGNGRSGLDLIWYVIKDVCSDAEIVYVSGRDDGRRCYVGVEVTV